MQKGHVCLAIVAIVVTTFFSKFATAFAYSETIDYSTVGEAPQYSFYYAEEDTFNLTARGAEFNESFVVPVRAEVVSAQGEPQSEKKDGVQMQALAMVNGREQPASDSTILFVLEEGDFVSLLERHGDWCQVSFGGKEAFVYSKYLEEV